MKRNASLLLLELLIMLLVFAFAAAVAVQVFFQADSLGRQSAIQDAALRQAQNAAEVLKACQGDFAKAADRYGGSWDKEWSIPYNEGWAPADTDTAYRLTAVPTVSDTPLLGEAVITVRDKDGAVLTTLTVCWQEVA